MRTRRDEMIQAKNLKEIDTHTHTRTRRRRWCEEEIIAFMGVWGYVRSVCQRMHCVCGDVRVDRFHHHHMKICGTLGWDSTILLSLAHAGSVVYCSWIWVGPNSHSYSSWTKWTTWMGLYYLLDYSEYNLNIIHFVENWMVIRLIESTQKSGRSKIEYWV